MALHYGEDLAFIHDAGFGHIAVGAAETLIDKLAFAGLRKGLIVELASGSGISSELLVGVGYDVLGFDISPQMTELARSRVPGARFEVSSLYDAAIPQCVAVTAIGEAFNYMADPRAGFDSTRAVFEKAYDALVPGGILIFDIAQPGRAMPRLELNHFSGPGWHVSSEVIELPGANRLERRVKSVRMLPEGARHSEEHHVLALYEPEAVHTALREIGFASQILASYAGKHRFGLGHGGYLATKR